MSEFDPEPILSRVFHRLRGSGFNLGVGEYVAARRAVEGGYGANWQELEVVLRLLWCHSPAEQGQFKLIWEALASEIAKAESKTTRPKPKSQTLPELKDEQFPPPPPETELGQPQPSLDLAPVPIRAPYAPVEVEDTPELQAYWPVSRRSMVYTWRYLRRPVPDGPEDVLDERATVTQAARQGFFLAPVYRRRESNRAHLLLLLDQDGSMTPFHRFTRDLVETAQYESTIQHVDVCYFHNVPAKSVYRDPHLTEPVLFERVLASCDGDTSVFIVSDGGAARGYRRLERIRATTEVLFQMKQQANLIAWLNPMPVERWAGTSAQIIAHLVPMYPMDEDGLSNAIDVVRGQPLQHYR
jgi:hypothetical protein